MSLPVPNLDDRTFAELVSQARQRVTETCPTWTDLSASDPGTTLVEVFAFLTETLLFRLNRLPEKAYVEFLRLLGVKLHSPAAASAMLCFERGPALDLALEVGLRLRHDELLRLEHRGRDEIADLLCLRSAKPAVPVKAGSSGCPHPLQCECLAQS